MESHNHDIQLPYANFDTYQQGQTFLNFDAIFIISERKMYMQAFLLMLLDRISPTASWHCLLFLLLVKFPREWRSSWLSDRLLWPEI